MDGGLVLVRAWAADRGRGCEIINRRSLCNRREGFSDTTKSQKCLSRSTKVKFDKLWPSTIFENKVLLEYNHTAFFIRLVQK